MKKFILAFLLSIALAATAYGDAGTYYVDFTCSGCDTTGSGTAGDPWQTIGKCTTDGATTGGGECRVAKYATTATDGNLTFTNGSTSVTTAVDETGNISGGDYVGLNGGVVSAADEAWWEVSSLNATTITLVKEYWGDGSGVAAQGYIANSGFVTTATLQINSSGTSQASRLKISGGWDLTGPTQDGQTFIDHNYSGYLWDFNINNYVEVSNFTYYNASLTTYNDYFVPGYGMLMKDCIFLEHYFYGWSGAKGDYNIFENVIQAGGPQYGIYISQERFFIFDSCKIFSNGDGSNDSGLHMVSASNGIFRDLEIYNAQQLILNISNSDHIYFENITAKENRQTSADGVNISNSAQLVFNNLDISDTIDIGLVIPATSFDLLFVDTSFTNIGTTETQLAGVNAASPANHHIKFVNYDDTAGDDRIYFSNNGTDPYIQRDTADARSGTCLKFWSFEADEPITYDVGVVKVLDGSRDMSLRVYMKDDVSFNGEVYLFAEVNGIQVDLPVVKTMTTSYVQQSITVDPADIATGDYVHLHVSVSGTAGSVYVDDFSATQ